MPRYQPINTWWSALTMLPADRTSDAYLRLHRVWHDQTRFRGPRPATAGLVRGHEFMDPTYETNLTVTLWENFALFEPAAWLPPLAEAAGFPLTPPVRACRWSYEWENRNPSGDGLAVKDCDIIIHLRDAQPENALLVVEAKNLGVKHFGKKDCEPWYYLDIEDLEKATTRRHMIYCVDAACKAALERQVKEGDRRWGFVTWQWVAALQIELAWQLDAPKPVRRFVAGALQYQFCQHGIRPDRLALPYLEDEPSQQAVEAVGQTNEERTRPLWRLE